MKRLPLILFFILTSEKIFSQSDYDRFLQALFKGDTILAKKIEKSTAHKTEPIEEQNFTKRNIPEYTFKVNLAQLKDSIIEFFKTENQINNRFLDQIFFNYMSKNDRSKKNKIQIFFHTETVKDSLFSRQYFSKPNTSNDIYVHAFGFTWFSKLYFSKSAPLEFRTAFIIKLTKLTDESTQVTIFAEEPKVINGIDGFSAHGPIAKETPVQPSSIEEYTLLLFIADKLGYKNLAQLKLPIKS